jgi:hypothetical protein
MGKINQQGSFAVARSSGDQYEFIFEQIMELFVQPRTLYQFCVLARQQDRRQNDRL